MSKFNASEFLTQTIDSLNAGAVCIVKLLKLSPENMQAVADEATALAASGKKGYQSIRLLLARVSWHAGEMRKAGKAPTHVLRSSTRGGTTTVRVAEYTYNAEKATKTSAPTTTATASAPTTTAPASDATATADPEADPAKLIADLRERLLSAIADLDAERAAHAATRSDLDAARALLASLNAGPAPVAADAVKPTRTRQRARA